MLQKYWPNENQIYHCIRTEAEELSSFVLQVVHEPMHLRELNTKNNQSRSIKTDAETVLLEHVKRHSRPIPILGDAGSGKSHLIRFLDVQLKNDPDTKDWIVKRIPKSSSLRQVLQILLEGMQGQVFDKLRNNIQEVGDKLKAEEVADHLIVFMSHRLGELLETTQDRIQSIQRSGGEVSEAEKITLQKIRKHAPSNRLPSLLGDPNFKERLIKPGRCLYNIAKRLTSGSTEDEISENHYELTVHDLDFESVVVGDFSKNAKSYIADLQLNTSSEKRTEVVELLNEILSDACRIAFQQFFQFNGGQFQDLFLDIRKQLIGKTLVILVEDMAAITAIEKELIDSLLREDTREGEQVLCTVKSAIAVTSGYEGYQRRRNTIVSRSGDLEWHIDIQYESDSEIYERIRNFCGRYLNAARYDLEVLKAEVQAGNLPLPPWHDSSIDDISKDSLESFGLSSHGYPLFPYNSTSLKVLTELYCRNSMDELEFNPRTILSHILIPILREYRHMFLQGTFPPANFLGLSPSSSLQGQLRINDKTKTEQVFSAVAFWGNGASDKRNLVHLMPPQIASVMGMEELSKLLGDTVPSEGNADVGIVHKPSPSTQPEVSPEPRKDAPEKNRTREVDEAFRLKNIDQNTARDIRNELYDLLCMELKYSKKWNGVNINIEKILKPGANRAPLINVPYSTSQTGKTYASFGTEATFADNVGSLRYKQFIVALLKRNDNKGTWDKSLYADYCHYVNFSKQWVDENIPTIILQLQKEHLPDKLQPAIDAATVLHPSFSSASMEEKANILLSHSEHWKESTVSRSGQEEWDEHVNKLIIDWDSLRKDWFEYVAHNNHAVSRDVFQPLLRGTVCKGSSKQKAQKAQLGLCRQYEEVLDPIRGCSNKEEFAELLDRMQQVVEKMNLSAQFEYPTGDITSRKLINKIKKVRQEDSLPTHWKATSKALKLILPFSFDDFVKAASQFDVKDLEPVLELLNIWKDVYEYNLPRYQSVNRGNDSASRVSKEEAVSSRVESTSRLLAELCLEQGVDINEAS